MFGQDRVLHLDMNEPGAGLWRREPSLSRNFAVPESRGTRRIEDDFIQSVGEFCEVAPETVTPIGSSRQYLDHVAVFSGATDLVVLENDFWSLQPVARRRGLPVVKIGSRPGHDVSIYQRLADIGRILRFPTFILTVGVTNPIQTTIDAGRALVAIRNGNPNSVVVFDTAYIDYCGIEHREIARLAVANPGVIIINPCKKSHFAAGSAVGWMITGDPILSRFAQVDEFPFRAPAASCRWMTSLLKMPASVERARELVCKARELNVETVARYAEPGDVVQGAGPWLLWNAGASANEIVRQLKDEGVLVQQQGGQGMLSSDWIRISATVPEDSEIFAARMQRVMTRIENGGDKVQRED